MLAPTDKNTQRQHIPEKTMIKTTRFPSKKVYRKPEPSVFLPPISIPKSVKDGLRVIAIEQDRDLTKQVRKVLVDYVEANGKS